jgi:quercetin dioxygenase-like cupin family protein
MATAKISCKLGEGSKTLIPLPDLAAPGLKICLTTAIKQQQQHEAFQRSTGRSSTTLAKYPDLRIVLVSMKAGTKMHEHKAAGRLSLLTLTGCVRLKVLGHTVDVPAGHLFTLDCCVPHDVEALRQSTFLLTISWPHGKDADAEKS